MNKKILLAAFALLAAATAFVPASACTRYAGPQYRSGDGGWCQDSFFMCSGSASDVYTVCAY